VSLTRFQVFGSNFTQTVGVAGGGVMFALQDVPTLTDLLIQGCNFDGTSTTTGV